MRVIPAATWTRLVFGILALAISAGLNGCRSGGGGSAQGSTEARFFVEGRPGEIGLPVTLPGGPEFSVLETPAFSSQDLQSVEVLARAEGPVLEMRFRPESQRGLYELSVVAMGRRLVLQVDGKWVGAFRMRREVEDGIVRIESAWPAEDLISLAGRLNLPASGTARYGR